MTTPLLVPRDYANTSPAPLLTFLCSIRDGVIFKTNKTNGFSDYYVFYDRKPVNLETIIAQISTRGIGTTPGYFSLYAAKLNFYGARPKGTQALFHGTQHFLFLPSTHFSFPRSTDLKSGLYY